MYPVSQNAQKTVKKQLCEIQKELSPSASPAIGDSSLQSVMKMDYFFVAYWKKKYPREVNPTLSMLASLQYSCV